MKSFLFDAIAMAIIGLLLFFYLNLEIEAFLVFLIGLFSLRQVRRLTSKRLRKQNSDLE